MHRIPSFLAVALGAAAVAGAAAATTTVTSPSSTFVYTRDVDNPGNPANLVALSGTATGGPVDLVCSKTQQPGAARFDDIALRTPVVADAWTVSSPLPRYQPCRIRAVDPGTIQTADLSDYPGPLVLTGSVATERSAGARQYNYYATSSQTDGYADFRSFGRCGFYDMNLVAGEVSSDELFYCNDHAPETLTAPIAPAGRSSILVDGKNAYAPGVDSGDKPGLPALTSTATRDATSGAITITESDLITNCAANPTTVQFADGACAAMTPSGVRMDRTIVQSNSGRTIDITDRWIATDGSAHQLDLWTSEQFRDPATAFRAPWVGSAFVRHVAADSIAPPQDGPATLMVRTDALADNDFAKPQGSITFAVPPLELKWLGPRDVLGHFVKTIPATGELVLRQTYNMGTNTAQLEAAANRASSVFSAPTLVVANPANGSTVATARLPVSGTATDRDAIKSVSVNGQLLGVGTGGGFATTLDLTPGANTITIVATSAAGTQTTVTRTVTFTPPAAPKPPAGPSLTVLGPKVIKTKLPKARVKGTSSGYTKILVNGHPATITAGGAWQITVRGLHKRKTLVLIVAGDAPTQTLAQRTIHYAPVKPKRKT
jgi:hypothetical protein